MSPIALSADVFSGSVATIALLLTLINTYFVFFRKGELRVSQPLQFYIGTDGGSDFPKILVGMLMYWTAPRGGVIDNMYAILKRGDTQHVFPIWLYGTKRELARATGIKISDQGIGLAHTFLLADEHLLVAINFHPESMT